MKKSLYAPTNSWCVMFRSPWRLVITAKINQDNPLVIHRRPHEYAMFQSATDLFIRLSEIKNDVLTVETPSNHTCKLKYDGKI